MSLRTKIILLFGLLAVIPMLALAAFSYWHAQNLLRESVKSQLQQMAQAVGQDLSRRTEEIEVALDSLPQATLDSAFLSQLPSLTGAAFIQIRDAMGPTQTIVGSVPGSGSQCVLDVESQILEFSKEILHDGGQKTFNVGFWVSDMVPASGHGPGHSISLLNPREGKVLYSDPCWAIASGGQLLPGSDLARALRLSEGPGTFRYGEGDQERWAASWNLPRQGLTVITTADSTPVAGPLNRLVVTYWIFVLGLGVSTSLAFSILIGRFTKSLSELARAAEEIGTGELDPWLPVPTSGEIGQLTHTLSRMLTRIRQMMTQVDQSGRLAVVGQLSAYLAHEIRNPLSSIKLNLQRLKRWAVSGELPDFCLEPLEISLREVERLSSSVSGVLQLSRAQDSPREVIGLHGLVEEAVGLLASKFRRQGVELKLDLDARADRVLARTGQLKSVILNLMVNALEAQPDGGSLEIRTELAREPEIGGPVVALHFKDTGSGISPEVRDRVFEPFFTTKAGGSGIGLAMAFQAVIDNGGDLYLEPVISSRSGAEFVVVFPLASVGPNVNVAPAEGRPLVNFRDRSPRWAIAKRPTDGGSSEGSRVPSHLMTPEGLEAVLALANTDTEDVN